MRVLFDTNVVLDVLLGRSPHAAPAAELFALVERGELRGWLGATTVTTVFYLAEKAAGSERAREHMRRLLFLFEVARVDRGTLLEALERDFIDYEDAVLHEAALQADVEGIVTRDSAGFARSTVPVFTPLELLAALASHQPSE